VKPQKEKGSLLITAIFIVAIFSVIAVGLLFWLRIESKNTASKRVAMKDYSYAEAGIERAVQKIQSDLILNAKFTDAIPGDTTSFSLIMGGLPVQVTVQDSW
jgi:type II secretory pathway component PulK